MDRGEDDASRAARRLALNGIGQIHHSVADLAVSYS
jgi:hypothetical protein